MKRLTRRQERRKSAGCDGKQRYATAGEAKAARDRLRREVGRFLHVYSCRFDKGAGRHWHLGHP